LPPLLYSLGTMPGQPISSRGLSKREKSSISATRTFHFG
jgi:hypothetical protein